MKCPVCEGSLVSKQVPYKIGKHNLGNFKADVCSSCGETFFTEESSDAIDKKALKKEFEDIVTPIRERIKAKGITRNDLKKIIRES